MTTARFMDSRVDTLRPAATAGLHWFAAVRPIALAVGIPVPSDADLAARFGVTEGIDVSALVRDASSLRSAVAVADEATRTVDAVGDRLPSVWTGVASDAAGRALDQHVARADDAIEQMRDIATTVDATAAALSKVLVAKYLSIAAIATDLVAGRPMTGITLADAEENRDAIASDIAAKTALFRAAVDVADTAVGEILTVLAASFEGLRARPPYPDGLTVTAGRPRSHRDDTRARPPRTEPQRTDMAVAPPAGGSVSRSAPRTADHAGGGQTARVAEPALSSAGTARAAPMGGVDPVPLVSALAQAAVASASAVGMAAVGGVGAVLNLAVEALGGPQDHGHGGLVPDASTQSGPTLSLNLDLDLDHERDRDPGEPDRPRDVVPDDVRPRTAEPTGADDRTPPDTATPAPTPAPTSPVPAPPPVAPNAGVDDNADVAPRPEAPAQTDPVVAPGPGSGSGDRPDRVDEPAADTNRSPQASPDPGDDGGLALAGDR
ncbi:hypothetical protein [Williamsia sp. M5A3_1d]